MQYVQSRRVARRVVIGAMLGCAVLAAGCGDEDNPVSTGGDAGVVVVGQINSSIRSDADIMGLLHESNLGEIQAGQLAQQRAVNAQVKAFATQMVTDHTALDQQGTALAQQLGITPTLPDSTLPRQQQAEMAVLTARTGAAFDQAYVAQQVVAHQRTLALVDASITLATRTQVRTMLQNQVRPAVVMHLQMAQQLQTTVGTP